jgi:hypothetical protein
VSPRKASARPGRLRSPPRSSVLVGQRPGGAEQHQRSSSGRRSPQCPTSLRMRTSQECGCRPHPALSRPLQGAPVPEHGGAIPALCLCELDPRGDPQPRHPKPRHPKPTTPPGPASSALTLGLVTILPKTSLPFKGHCVEKDESARSCLPGPPPRVQAGPSLLRKPVHTHSSSLLQKLVRGGKSLKSGDVSYIFIIQNRPPDCRGRARPTLFLTSVDVLGALFCRPGAQAAGQWRHSCQLPRPHFELCGHQFAKET